MFFSDSVQQVPAELGAGEPCKPSTPTHPLVLGEIRESAYSRYLRVGTVVLTKGHRIRTEYVPALCANETYVEHGEA